MIVLRAGESAILPQQYVTIWNNSVWPLILTQCSVPHFHNHPAPAPCFLCRGTGTDLNHETENYSQGIGHSGLPTLHFLAKILWTLEQWWSLLSSEPWILIAELMIAITESKPVLCQTSESWLSPLHCGQVLMPRHQHDQEWWWRLWPTVARAQHCFLF